MFNKNFLLLILLLIKTILSLKPTDLCNNIQEECKGSYDHNQKYQVKCERFKCQGKYNFQCDFNKCAMSKKNCDDYTRFAYYLRLQNEFISQMSQYKYYSSIENQSFYKKQGQKLILFNQHIGICPVIQYKWKPSDVCINGLKCFEKIKILKGFGYNYYKKPADCKCPSSHSFQCGKISSKFICSVNQGACETIKGLKTLFGIQNCRNHNIF